MRRNQKRTMSRPAAGALLMVFALLVTYFGFTKAIPFQHHYTVKADFKNAVNVRKGSFVRIGGVNVGKVTGIGRPRKGDDTVRLTLRIDDIGRPIHTDATIQIRPNIFLEGNTFLDLRPGTPTAPVLGDGKAIPARQTSSAVQIDQILGALQTNTREDLKRLLAEFNTGLSEQGGIAFNKSVQYWVPAYRDSAIVNDATLGIERHDLSKYLSAAGSVAAALDRNPPALKSLITDFNTTAAAFASEQTALEATVAELPRTLRAARPALLHLNNSFPPVRRLVVDLRPAARSTGPMIDASLPLIRQANGLLGASELRGLVADLRSVVPDLALLNTETTDLLEQARTAASCQNEVILPWSHDTVPDPNFPATGQVFQEGVKGLPGIGAESRSGDANNQWARVLAGNGLFTNSLGTGPDGQPRFGQSNNPIQGSNPPKSARPPSRYDVPCETQEKPDLRTIPGQGLQQVSKSKSSGSPRLDAMGNVAAYEAAAQSLKQKGQKAAAKAEQARAQALRKQFHLEGKMLGMVGKRLGIVDKTPLAKALSKGLSTLPASGSAQGGGN